MPQNMKINKRQTYCFFLPGTPEIGGLSTIQAMEIIQGCKGLNIVGGDIVEVRTVGLDWYAMHSNKQNVHS